MMRYRTDATSVLAMAGFVTSGLAIAAALVIPGRSVQGQESTGPSLEAPSREAPSLDTQLLDDLDKELFEGLPPLPPTRPKAGDAQPAGNSPTVDPPAATSEAETTLEFAPTLPLARIGQQMLEVQSRIAGRDTSAQTQKAQQAIAAELAALIEQARQQCAACKQGGSGSGQGALAGTSGQPVPAPPRDSTDRIEQGTKEAVETAEVHDLLRRFWGHLPDKLRDEMQSSLSEQFLPKYETIIEDYYRRLAEDPRGRP
jgi:hypothetical protein